MNSIKNPVLNIKHEAENTLIDLATVKNFLKIDFDEDDSLIIKLIKTAINQCETNINKSLIEKTYIYSIYEIKLSLIVLPYSTLKSIEKITLVNIDNSEIIMDTDNYFLDIVGGILNFKNKPSNFYRIDIEYTAGLENINDELIHALLMHIARMYEDRSGYSPIPLNSLNIYKKYKQIRL